MRLVAERARRNMEALSLYEPLPSQGAFHASLSSERLLRGSNRGGKTLPAAVEVARAVTGQDPSRKYPLTGGRCFCVGKDETHVGQVMWRKLGRAGAFQIIRDQSTGLWRSYRPWLDGGRASEVKPSPPLIPPRLIKSVSWYDKKEGIPKIVTLHNGWELVFYSSKGTPPNGADIDLAWFDEEIVVDEWYPEISARLLDRCGRFFWSATPQAGTEQLYVLHERATDPALRDGKVEEFVVLLNDNPHISEEQKAAFVQKLSEDERKVRVGGEFIITSFRVYPEFQATVHCCDFFPVPGDWTRYAAIDPGHQVCAVVFLTVPPPEDQARGRHVYVYDELYLRRCDADKFGKAMAERCQGQSMRMFLIDHQAGRQTEMASGETVEVQYSRSLRKHKVTSVAGGHAFAWPPSDLKAGIESVRDWLRIGEGGRPTLQILKDRCPNLLHELKYYHFRRQQNRITDEPEKKNNHAVDCLRYLAVSGLRYVRPRVSVKTDDSAVRAYRDKRKRKRDKSDGPMVSLGPGGPS